MTIFKTDKLVVEGQYATVAGYRLLANSQIINGDVVPIIPGMPVTIVGNQTVKRSSAANTGLAGVDGIIWSGNSQTNSMMMRAAGLVSLPTNEWDMVTGGSGGLIPGVSYFLGIEPGTITTTPPTQVGHSITKIGKAFTPDSLFIEIGSPLLL